MAVHYIRGNPFTVVKTLNEFDRNIRVQITYYMFAKFIKYLFF